MVNNLLKTNSPELFDQFEWGRIIDFLNNFTHFEINKTIYYDIHFYTSNADIAQIYQNIEDFSEVYHKNSQFFELYQNISPDKELLSSIEALSKGALLGLKEIHQVSLLVEFFFMLYNSEVNVYQIKIENVKNEQRKIQKGYLKEFRSFVSINGDINYLQHPLLKSIYLEIKSTTSKITEHISQLMNNKEYQSSIQINNYDIIDDRYVLPIKTDHYNSSLGRIVARSETGHTLYVEPYVIENFSNKRNELLNQFENEKIKIERKYSRFLFDNISYLKKIYDETLRIDFYCSRLKFHKYFHLKKPDISNSLSLKINNLRHPLIENCVANDIFFNNKKGFIISGPNTGGKTITLKSIAIAQLLFQMGCYVPSTSATLGCFDSLFFHGQDFQNVNEGLSSFSSEITSLSTTFQELNERNLLICDEIFNTTSSSEASALAYAWCLEFINQNTTYILLSTHHENLKNYFFKDDLFESAHMGFDLSSNKPTYRLIMGTPGSSYALNIFNNLIQFEKKDRIANFAKKLLSEEYEDFEQLTLKLSKQEHYIQKTLDDISRRELIIEQKEKQTQALLGMKEEELKSKYLSLEQKYQNKAERILEEIRKAEIKNKNKIFTNLKIPIDKEKQENKLLSFPINDIQEGMYLFSKKLNKDVQILKINNNKAIVSSGKIKATLPLSDFYFSSYKKPQNTVSVSFQKETSSQLVFDCRGKRLDEFISIVETALSNLKVDNLPYIEIIHGHGDGILKNWLIQYIHKSQDFIIEKNLSGNDGSSIIKVRL